MSYQRNRLIQHIQDRTAHNGRWVMNPPSEMKRWLMAELEAEHRSYHSEPGCHLIDPQLHELGLHWNCERKSA